MKHCDKKAVTINVTNKCNLHCVYCMASSPDEQDQSYSIPIEFAKTGISDSINGHPTGIPASIIRIFGPGEPTQEMSIIKECITFAKSLKPNIKTEIQTNGLFQSEEDAIWIGKNFDIVWISLDGPSEINDISRPHSNGKGMTKVIEHYLKIISSYTNIGIRATITNETIDKQIDLVHHFHNLQVKYLAFNPVINPIFRNVKENTSVNKINQLSFAKFFCDAHAIAEILGIELLNSMTINFDEPTIHGCRSSLPMPQLNPDGSVSSCDMAMYSDVSDALKVFIYGKWLPDEHAIKYDYNKILSLQNNNLKKLPECQTCVIGEYCAGGCIGRTVYQTGTLGNIIPQVCDATRYMAKHIKTGSKKLLYTHP